MRLHAFLPENDLALASGLANYTPPKAARALSAAGAALPLWYGDAGDRVLCYGLPEAWYERMARDFSLTTDIFDHRPLPGIEPAPWGWSAYARRRYEREGFSADMLPTDEAIEHMRRLSHRSTGARLARMLAERLPHLRFTAPAIEITDTETLSRIEGDFVLKSPFSSSGRGVWLSTDYDRNPSALTRIASDIIRLQGSVMVEPLHRRLLDFARIYECRDGKCRDLGTSVFATDEHGAYVGNILAPESARLRCVRRVYPVEKVELVSMVLREIIEAEIAPYYTGILGIDMLVAHSREHRVVLDPVVELNLRTTMGYVANRFYEQHVSPDSVGVFAVMPLRDTPAPADGYTTEGCRLVRGTLNLVPENPYFAFTCKVTK